MARGAFSSGAGSAGSAPSRRRETVASAERVTYKRMLLGSRQRVGHPVELIVVLHAIHGDSNREALTQFLDKASGGGSVKFNAGSGVREESVHAVGFMGRNPLLKAGKPPSERDLDLPEPTKGGGAIPSFSIAAHSRETLGTWLRESGSPALLLSRSAVASEGYLLEAVLHGMAENEPGYAIRTRATETYASTRSCRSWRPRFTFRRPFGLRASLRRIRQTGSAVSSAFWLRLTQRAINCSSWPLPQ
jgi:hypothetical protein